MQPGAGEGRGHREWSPGEWLYWLTLARWQQGHIVLIVVSGAILDGWRFLGPLLTWTGCAAGRTPGRSGVSWRG